MYIKVRVRVRVKKLLYRIIHIIYAFGDMFCAMCFAFDFSEPRTPLPLQEINLSCAFTEDRKVLLDCSLQQYGHSNGFQIVDRISSVELSKNRFLSFEFLSDKVVSRHADSMLLFFNGRNKCDQKQQISFENLMVYYTIPKN